MGEPNAGSRPLALVADVGGVSVATHTPWSWQCLASTQLWAFLSCSGARGIRPTPVNLHDPFFLESILFCRSCTCQDPQLLSSPGSSQDLIRLRVVKLLSAPSGGRWQHSPERAQSPGGWLGPGGQHCCGRDLLAVDLPSVHVLECLRSLFRILELHVGMALRRMRVHAQTKSWAEGIRVPAPLAGRGSTTARGILRLCPESACPTGRPWSSPPA